MGRGRNQLGFYLVQTMEEPVVKKDLNSLIEQALVNINKDRQETELLLSSLKEYNSLASERIVDTGSTAAKFLETLQRSNEQLVKLASLVHKKDISKGDMSLSDNDKEQLFDLIKD